MKSTILCIALYILLLIDGIREIWFEFWYFEKFNTRLVAMFAINKIVNLCYTILSNTFLRHKQTQEVEP